jgi:hypothetical protein
MVVQLVARAIMLPDLYERPPPRAVGHQGHRPCNAVGGKSDADTLALRATAPVHSHRDASGPRPTRRARDARSADTPGTQHCMLTLLSNQSLFDSNCPGTAHFGKVGGPLWDCLAHGFLICCWATPGKIDTPSWRVTTGDLRQGALREPRHPATEVLLCHTEAMTGWP